MTAEFQDGSQIVIMLIIRNEAGDTQEVEAVVDTGFGGYLMLTAKIVQTLALPQIDVANAILADGSVVRLAVHEVIIIWDEEDLTVPAYVGEGDILLGMSLLRDHIGTFEFFPGGLSTIEPAE